jgi:hypothetical protein
MNAQTSGPYLLDTNVFIEAHRRYYTMDLCPGFWKCLEHYCEESRVLSIDRVRGEISEGDALDEWISQAPDGLFAPTAQVEVVEAFTEMMTWVQDNGLFLPQAKDEFARVADGRLVAYAKAHDLVVITQEVFAADSRKRVPIPNVCRQFDVPYDDTFSMLRALGVRFDWK